jgi:hypothetical protein
MPGKAEILARTRLRQLFPDGQTGDRCQPAPAVRDKAT